MSEGQRIKCKKVEISDQEVFDFFENRTKKELFHRFNLVNYQDNNPTLALERDRMEKRKIFPLLNIHEDHQILDIGCGVGRWGDEIVSHLRTGRYIGIDYSESLINVAQKAAEEDGKKSLREYYVGAFQDLQDVLKKNNINTLFDLIIINGVLMYINDIDLEKCLNAIPKILKKNGLIYIKESIGINDRFTLNGIYSEELSSKYSAIYRSRIEYEEFFDRVLNLHNNSILKKGETFGEDLHNRSETTSYYWIIKNSIR